MLKAFAFALSRFGGTF